MSMFGASGLSGWLGDIHATRSSVPGSRRRLWGISDVECVPPAMTTRSIPAIVEAAAALTAAKPDAQWRLTAKPATSVSPAWMAA